MQTVARAKADASTQGKTAVESADPFPWRWVLGIFVIVSAVLTVVVALNSSGVLPDGVHRGGVVLQGPAWLDGWFQFDAGWYYEIAANGYNFIPGQQSSIAFFPAYPMAVRALGAIVGDYQVAGSLIGVVAGAGTVLLFGSWVWRRLARPAAVAAIAVLMLYPYALYLYGAMYGDSLFLLTAVGAFLLLERRMYWLAGLVGVFATAGRPVGIAVTIGLVVRMLELRAQDRRAANDPGLARTEPLAGDLAVDRPRWRELVGAITVVRWREAGVLLSGAGLLSWIVYLWIEFGHPLAFVEAESAPGWDQGVGPHTWFKLNYFRILMQPPAFSNGRSLTLQALGCLIAVLLLRRVWRRFGWGYAVYSAVVIAIPIIGTDDFMSTGRYLLAAFPIAAAAGDFLVNAKWRWVRPVALVTSAVLLIVLTVLFAKGFEVS